MTNYKDNTFECLCHKGFIGEYCEQGKSHSKNLLHFNKYNYNLAQLGCVNLFRVFYIRVSFNLNSSATELKGNVI